MKATIFWLTCALGTVLKNRHVTGQGVNHGSCDDLFAEETRMTFRSHASYPRQYGPGIVSCWEVQVPQDMQADQVVRVEIESFQLEESAFCAFDLLRVYCREPNGFDSLIDTFCGARDFDGYIYAPTDGGSLVFEFETDASLFYDGFEIAYEAVDASILGSTTPCASPNITVNPLDDLDDAINRLATSILIVIIIGAVLVIAGIAACVFCVVKAANRKPVVVQPVMAAAPPPGYSAPQAGYGGPFQYQQQPPGYAQQQPMQGVADPNKYY